MRQYTVTGLVALLSLLAACGRGNPHTGETDTDDTDEETDTDTDPGVTGTIQVVSTFDGPQVDCFVNLNGVKKGTTNTPISGVNVGTYDLTLGNLDDLSADGIPIHDLGDSKGKVIAPIDTTFEVVEGQNDPVTRTFNRYISGRWKCTLSSAPGSPWTGDVIFEEGHLLSTGVFENMNVDGESLHYEGDGAVQNGSFTSPTTLHIDSTGGMAGDFSIDCNAVQ